MRNNLDFQSQREYNQDLIKEETKCILVGSQQKQRINLKLNY